MLVTLTPLSQECLTDHCFSILGPFSIFGVSTQFNFNFFHYFLRSSIISVQFLISHILWHLIWVTVVIVAFLWMLSFHGLISPQSYWRQIVNSLSILSTMIFDWSSLLHCQEKIINTWLYHIGCKSSKDKKKKSIFVNGCLTRIYTVWELTNIAQYFQITVIAVCGPWVQV